MFLRGILGVQTIAHTGCRVSGLWAEVLGLGKGI